MDTNLATTVDTLAHDIAKHKKQYGMRTPLSDELNQRIRNVIGPCTKKELMKALGMSGSTLQRIESAYDAKSVVSVGKKNDAGKTRYDLIPPWSEQEVADVLTFGAAKYGDDNWREVEDAEQRYYAAARRHIAAYHCGETKDPESGFHHLAHAICCLMFLLEFELELE